MHLQKLKVLLLASSVFAIAFAVGVFVGPGGDSRREMARQRSVAWAEEEKPAAVSADKQKLAAIQGVVGSWRGVGQLQRGSTKGSWVEKADWAWDFSGGTVAIIGKLSDGKYLQSLKLMATADGKKYRLELVGPDGKSVGEPWLGTVAEDGGITFTSPSPAEGVLSRVTLRQVAGGDRMLILLEKASSASAGGFARLAEVGYTRKGSGFGQGVQGRECVVTGGAGSMEVTFMGKTYAVCCTGCRDYFNDNPAKTLAEYRERKEQEKAAKQ